MRKSRIECEVCHSTDATDGNVYRREDGLLVFHCKCCVDGHETILKQPRRKKGGIKQKKEEASPLDAEDKTFYNEAYNFIKNHMRDNKKSHRKEKLKEGLFVALGIAVFVCGGACLFFLSRCNDESAGNLPTGEGSSSENSGMTDSSDDGEIVTASIKYTIYTTSDGQKYAAVTGGYDGTLEEAIIVAEYKDEESGEVVPVTEIAAGAFSGNTVLTSVEIPASVTKIDVSAFNGCAKLSSIIVAESNVTYASQDGILYNEKMTDFVYIPQALMGEVTIPESITKISASAFYGRSGLSSVELNGVEIIERSAFSGCSNLQSVEMSSISKIEAEAFTGCTTLKSVCYNKDIGAWTNIEFVEQSANPLSNGAGFYIYNATSKDYELVEELVIPNAAMIIRDYVFYNCDSIKTVEIPDSITSIGKSVFENCDLLETVTLPFIGETKNGAENTHFGYIFGNSIPTKLKNITVTGGTIAERAFSGCKDVTNIILGDGVTSIGASAFSSCVSLESITLPFVGATKNGTENTHFGYIFGASDYSSNSNYVPVSLKSVTVTGGKIAENAVANCGNITNLTLGDNVTEIGYGAFSSCGSLESITIPFVGETKDGTENTHFGYIFGADEYDDNSCVIPDSLQDVIVMGGKIDDYAFYFSQWNFERCTALFRLEIGDDVVSIGYKAFWYCIALQSVIIGDRVPSIRESTFSYCYNLVSVQLGASVEHIAEDAFGQCDKLVEIYNKSSLEIKIGAPDYAYAGWFNLENVYTPTSGESKLSTTEDGYILYTDHIYYINNIYTNHIEVCLMGYTGSETELTLPSNVTYIYYYAFYNCDSITSVEIGENVTSIGRDAFYGCSGLMSVEIGENVTSIGSSAFSGCSRLVEIYNKSSLEITAGSTDYGNVGYYAKNVYTPTSGESKLSTTEDGYILYTDNEEVWLISYTGSSTLFYLPSDVTGIYEYAFEGCSNITSVYYKGDIADWCNITFGDYSVNPLYDAENFYIYNEGKGKYELVTELVIPDTVTEIKKYAFSGCSSITSVEISDSVESIDTWAFHNCDNLTDVYYKGDIADWCNIMFDFDANPTGQVNYGGTNFYIYSKEKEEYELVTELVIPDTVTEIKAYAFSGCTSLEGVTLPDSVTSIGEDAFFACNSMVNVYYKGNIEGWCNITFDNEGANPLSIGVGNLYTYNEEQGKYKLVRDLSIPNTITEIKDYAFSGCSSLESIMIPNSVKSIGNYAFYNCYSNYNLIVTIPDSVESIGDYAFSGASLREVVIGDGVTKVGASAFYCCTGLKSVTIGKNVTYIGERAFQNCSQLTSIKFEGTVAQFNAITKVDGWNRNVPATEVVCSDGRVSI